MVKDEQILTIDGHPVRITHPDKVLYPSTGTTKQDVIDYYRAMSATMLPYCRDRAATRKRWPDGVGDAGRGESFFQKNLGASAPGWVRTAEIQHKDHINTYPLVNDEATLVWLSQLNTLEIHVPQWRFDPGENRMNPDRMVFDLDPGEGITLRQCADVAFMIRRKLRELGLESVPVTSGSKGIHLYAPLGGNLTSEQAVGIAREIAQTLEQEHPELVTSSMKKSLRAGKVFVDWSQNNPSKTTVAPYSLRGRIKPTVAAPRTCLLYTSPSPRD